MKKATNSGRGSIIWAIAASVVAFLAAWVGAFLFAANVMRDSPIALLARRLRENVYYSTDFASAPLTNPAGLEWQMDWMVFPTAMIVGGIVFGLMVARQTPRKRALRSAIVTGLVIAIVSLVFPWATVWAFKAARIGGPVEGRADPHYLLLAALALIVWAGAYLAGAVFGYEGRRPRTP